MSLHTAYFEEEDNLQGQLSNLSAKEYNDSSSALYKTLENQNNEQKLEIDEKEKLILTRNRMLQIAYDRNIFKKKIINI